SAIREQLWKRCKPDAGRSERRATTARNPTRWRSESARLTLAPASGSRRKRCGVVLATGLPRVCASSRSATSARLDEPPSGCWRDTRFNQNLVGPCSTDRGEQRAPGEQIEHFVAAVVAFPVMIGAAGSNADHPEHGGTVAGVVRDHVWRRRPDSCPAGGDAALLHSSAPRKSVSRSSFGATPFFCSRMPALPR